MLFLLYGPFTWRRWVNNSVELETAGMVEVLGRRLNSDFGHVKADESCAMRYDMNFLTTEFERLQNNDQSPTNPFLEFRGYINEDPARLGRRQKFYF
jgi:hypothetical protein